MNLERMASPGPATALRAKLRALYFRWPLEGDPNPIRWIQEQEVLDRLSPHFDVVTIDKGGDYGRLVDRHKPDLVLFESKAVAARKPVIVGARGDTSVPKAMLIRSDAMCYSRRDLLDDVEMLDIDACFAIDSLYAFYLEELRERLFYIPHSVDPTVFRNYGLPKSELIAFYGHFLPSRPWKVETARVLKEAFTCTFHPHDTTRTSASSTRMAFGEAYARRLNQAEFVPVEGGFHNMVTRKFLEVPAVGATLVAPRFEMLEQFGFADMVNCVLGQPSELVEKIDHLLAHPAEHRGLTAAGQRLVRERHLHAHRRQLRDWFHAFSAKPAGSVVRQSSVFGEFFTVEGPQASEVPPLAPAEMPIDHVLLKRAERAIGARDLAAAEGDLIACMNLLYARHFMEPRFYLALVRLLQGRALEALFFLTAHFVKRAARKGAQTLDPREAALLIVAYLALGEPAKAAAVAEVHRGLDHPELHHAMLMVGMDNPEPNRTASLFNLVPLNDPHVWGVFVRDVARAHGREVTMDLSPSLDGFPEGTDA